MCTCTHVRENQRQSSEPALQISSTHMDAYTHAYIFPQTDLSVGVLTVLVKGPCLRLRSVRALCCLISVRRLRER